MTSFLIFICIIGFVCGKLDIQFNNDYADYSIVVNGNNWLNSHETQFTNFGDWATLQLNSTSSQNGMDIFGNYSELTISYIDTNHPEYTFKTIFKQYSNIIIFTQYYPNGAKQTFRNNINTVISAFPSFRVMNASNGINLGYIKWSGHPGGAQTQYGQWSGNLSTSSSLRGGIALSGPLLLYNDILTECIVISSLTYSMASNDEFTESNNQRHLRYGIQGNVTVVNPGFNISYIMSLTNNGINQCMKGWGDLLLKYYNKKRGNAHSRDFTLNYLGYSTDHGAYYFYYQEPNKTAEQTLIDLHKYHQSLNIPTKWLLLDSWWYQQSGPSQSNGKGQDYNFTANVTLFPNGQHIHQQTGWFIQSQNRAWAYDCVYTKDFQCTYNESTWESAPTETDKFWNYLFSINNPQTWGMIVYEQDHLSQFTVDLQLFMNNTEFGRDYMMSMGNNAFKYNLSNQYCMSFPRHILQSAELPSVTQARTSGDYHPGKKNWNIGHTSLFTSSLDIMPSKDSYWTMNTPQTTGDRGECTKSSPCIEPYNRLNSAILSLSNGPYTFADRIGYTDYNVIMKCCMNTSGLLLRPSVAVTAIDKYFTNKAGFNNGANGDVYTTMSIINSNIGNIYYYYIFVAELNDKFNISTNDVTYYNNDDDNNKVNVSNYLVYETNTTSKFVPFNTNTMMELNTCHQYDFQLHTVIPIDYYNNIGWYLQGEIDKWITVSAQRFTNINIDTSNKILQVSINGDENEMVNIGFVNDNNHQQIVQCTVPSSGTVTVTMPGATCN